jgi:hypothetical protein
VREVACPSCGGPVTFASSVSLLAVCGHCRATLLRRDLDVERLGTMALLLEDRSPVQIGAEGRWRGTGFAVVGRVQVRWEHGAWNEWYCLFDDGRAGWLGEAGGEYTLTFEAQASSLPPWSALRPGLRLRLAGVEHEVVDVRKARVVGGEGELPFRVDSGQETAVADLRGDGGGFASLDYGDDPPRVYLGEVVALGDLALRGLREPSSWR